MSKEYVSTNGLGYRNAAAIANIYAKIFGKHVFDGKFKDAEKFDEKLIKRFGDGIDKIDEDFEKKGTAKDKIYRGYNTALEFFAKDRKIRYEENGFDLYDYLKKSNLIKKSLPQRDFNYGNFAGRINTENPIIFDDKIAEIDEEIVIQQLRPDLIGEQTEPDKIIEKKQFLTVLNSLRDNIEGLTKEDIEKVSYGEMSKYNHSNMSCLVIKAGEKEFMTFASENNYLGSAEFSELPQDYANEIFKDEKKVQFATVPTLRNKWSIIKDENGYIPLTDNPNMEYVELLNEVYLDGKEVRKSEDKKQDNITGKKIEDMIIKAYTRNENRERLSRIGSTLGIARGNLSDPMVGARVGEFKRTYKKHIYN